MTEAKQNTCLILFLVIKIVLIQYTHFLFLWVNIYLLSEDVAHDEEKPPDEAAAETEEAPPPEAVEAADEIVPEVVEEEMEPDDGRKFHCSCDGKNLSAKFEY